MVPCTMGWIPIAVVHFRVVAGVCRVKTRIRQGGYAEEINQTEVRT